MSTSVIDKVKSAAGIAPKHVTVQEAIERRVPEFAKLLGAMDPVRFARIAVSQVNQNPKIAEDIPGMLSCIAIAATLKLELGVLGQCYIVPYRRHGKVQNQFITGWMGHVDLVTRAQRATVRTLAVREGDEFDCDLGSKPFVRFKPDVDGTDDRPLLYTVAIGHTVGMNEFPQIEVWGYEKLRRHLNSVNKVGDMHYALQTGKNLQNSHNFEMWARKIPLLQVVKYLPKSVEWRTAAQLDALSENGRQALDYQTTRKIIDGEIEPAQLESEPEPEAPPVPIDPKVAKMNDAFALLMWDAQTQAKWLEANAKLSADEKLAKLEAILST